MTMDIQQAIKKPTKKKKQRPFFSNPWLFSFKDFVCVTIIAIFIYAVVKALMPPYPSGALEVVKTLIAPVMLVLGSYTSDEVAGKYFMSKYPQGYAQGMSMYSGYGGYSGYSPQVPIVTPTETATDVDTNEENEYKVPDKY
jgi:hypothetical protein